MNESSTFNSLKLGRPPAEAKLASIETDFLIVTVYVI